MHFADMSDTLIFVCESILCLLNIHCNPVANFNLVSFLAIIPLAKVFFYDSTCSTHTH